MNPEIFLLCVVMVLLPCFVETGYKDAATGVPRHDPALTIC